MDSDDDEETFKEQEKHERTRQADGDADDNDDNAGNHDAEIATLDEEAEMPLEELMKLYGGAFTEEAIEDDSFIKNAQGAMDDPKDDARKNGNDEDLEKSRGVDKNDVGKDADDNNDDAKELKATMADSDDEDEEEEDEDEFGDDEEEEEEKEEGGEGEEEGEDGLDSLLQDIDEESSLSGNCKWSLDWQCMCRL